jgi:hypothetical protein
MKSYILYDITPYSLKNAVFWDVTLCGSCKNDVSEKLGTSIIRVTKTVELGTTLAVTSNRRTLRRVLPFPRIYRSLYGLNDEHD